MNYVNFAPKLREYLDAVEAALLNAGIEITIRAGIIRDLEAQIAEMRAEEGLSDDDILSRLDPPEAYSESLPPSAAPRRFHPLKSTIFYIITIILSAAAVLIEITSGLCADSFGDPIPTSLHLAGLITVPIVLALTAAALRKSVSRTMSRLLYLMNGFVFAFTLWYSVAFLRLMPVAFISIPFVFSGLGILGLLLYAPSMSFIASCLQKHQLRKYLSDSRGVRIRRWWYAGLAAAVFLFGSCEARQFAVDNAIARAISGDPDGRKSAMNVIGLLRAENILLDYCNNIPREWASGKFLLMLENTQKRFPLSEYRALYYRMTGQDHREAERSLFSRIKSKNDPWGVLASSPEIGGPEVGAASQGLLLKSVAVDVSLSSSSDGADAGPGLAYAEYTIEFQNNGAQAEARAQMIMPPGGAASRLTLWIDGEEREAAFGRRKSVKEAYGSVVRRKRDPALVTTAGPDRILLQCFPINSGGTLKVRVGFTLPLVPDGDEMILALPYFAERNFSIPADLRCAAWAESGSPISADIADLASETVSADSRPVYVVRGKIAPAELASAQIRTLAPRPGTVYRAELAGVSAVSSFFEATPLENRTAALVLDTSKQCAPLFAPQSGELDWEKILKSLPDGVKLALYAGSTFIPPMDREEAIARWPDALRRVKFQGADEQAGNISSALELCSGSENGAVLWLHGNLPVEISDLTALEQQFRRRSSGENGSARLFSIQAIPGPNRLEERLPQITRRQPFYGVPLEERLSRLFSDLLFLNLSKNETVFSLCGPEQITAPESSPHIARLAFADETRVKLNESPDEASMENYVTGAVKMRIVTPATGAVVLENAEQFEQNDLDPALDLESIPTIPEPEEWALAIITIFILLSVYLLRKKRYFKGGNAV